MSLRLLFAGVAPFALRLLDAGHELGAVSLPYLDDEPEIWDLLTHCSSEGIPVYPPFRLTHDADQEQREELASHGPFDVMLVMNFDRKIARWARVLGRKGAWNVHPSLLPKHRGYNPYYWTIRSGDDVSGVSLHHMADGFDTGDIILQQSVNVLPGSTSGHLWEQLNDISIPLVLEALEMVERGETLPSLPQEVARATQAPKPKVHHLEVSRTDSVDEVLRAIRAATPQPGPTLTIRGTPYIIRGARPGPRTPPGSSPGDFFVVDGQAAMVVGNGSVILLTLEARGGVMLSPLDALGLGGGS